METRYQQRAVSQYQSNYQDYQQAFENYELDYWSKKFGVTREQLRQAISKVGLMADDVERYLRMHHLQS